jgi:hypothetical protein
MKLDLNKYHNLALETKELLKLKEIEESEKQKKSDEEKECLRINSIKLKAKEYYDKIPELCEKAAKRGDLFFVLYSEERKNEYNDILHELKKLLEVNNIEYEIYTKHYHDEGCNANDAYIPPRDYYWIELVINF